MQIIAMITMLIDHIGVIFFPDEATWRIIGRIAFPFYAYAIIVGYYHTANVKRYVLRLLTLAFIAQIPFMLAFNTWKLNVIFTLFVSLVVLIILKKLNNVGLTLLVLVTASLLMEIVPMDYGAYGMLLIVIYRYCNAYWKLILHFALNAFYYFYQGWDMQMYSLMSTLIIVMVPHIADIGRKHTPIWLWRSFYPAHLLILAVLYSVLSN